MAPHTGSSSITARFCSDSHHFHTPLWTSDQLWSSLGGVPLLQRLPGSSLKKIAELVIVKRYEEGQYIIRQGEVGEGIYFIWKGEAQVCGTVNEEEEGRPEFQLRQYDYFGDGFPASAQQADVIALSKLICLSILHLESIEVNIFQGITLPDAPRFGKVFGGQFVGQALAAASKTVDCLKLVHSLHAYFLLIGDLDMPIIYNVQRIRDGKSFATRKVDAIQKGNIVFTLMASFQKEEHGYVHQLAQMPAVPEPELLLSMEELREKRLTDPLLPRSYRNKVAAKEFVPWPMEIRFCEPNTNTNQTKSPPSLKYWFRAKGKLSDDQALHRCVITRCGSIGLLRADEWLLFAIVSPAAYNARGFVLGEIFNRKGEHVVSVTQEGLLRTFASTNQARNPTTSSKL
ncbi:hypothetical protein OIU76_005811 [Salix suchowensis]|nr:hypothetical protein OIU76_005811 [Salix suchowensis]